MPNGYLGRWAGDATLPNSLMTYTGTGYTAGASEVEQFVHSVMTLLAERIVGGTIAVGPERSIFLLGTAHDSGGVRYRRFRMEGIPSPGKVWFSLRFDSSIGFTLPDGGDDVCADFIESELAAGGFPALWYDPKSASDSVTFYPDGIADSENCVNLRILGHALTLEDVEQSLHRAHEVGLLAPPDCDLAGDCWQNGAAGHPAREPEKKVQRILRSLLNMDLRRLGTFFVRQEITTTAGRCDLMVIEHDPYTPGVQKNHVLLELKVVRDFRASGERFPPRENEKAVIKGVRQAFTYAKDHGATHKALCCYDMRLPPNPKQAVSHIVKRAAVLNVKLWSWPMYGDAEALRVAIERDALASNDDDLDQPVSGPTSA